MQITGLQENPLCQNYNYFLARFMKCLIAHEIVTILHKQRFQKTNIHHLMQANTNKKNIKFKGETMLNITHGY